MLFNAAPADVSKTTNKTTLEKTVAWTLQSTQQIEVMNADVCTQYAEKLHALIKPVNTMTVRTYCLCPYSRPHTDPKTGQETDLCLDNQVQMNAVPALKDLKINPGIELIGPNPKGRRSQGTEDRIPPMRDQLPSLR